MRHLRIALITLLFPVLLLWTTVSTGAASLAALALQEGRTYDQAHDRGYIDWSGPAQYVYITHRDGSSLPPEEGGTYCGSSCSEWVTRLGNGGAASGSFDRDVAYFEVMVGFTPDPGAGSATLRACSAVKTWYLQAGSGLPGFVSMDLTVPAGCRSWSLTAAGGYVDFRSVDVTYAAAPPTATPTLTITPTSTTVFTSTPTPTSTSTRTAVPSATYPATSTATSTATYTSSATVTYTATATFTFTPTNTATATATQTVTPSRTPASTATWTFTPPPTSTQTATFTAAATNTSTPSRTPTFTPRNTASPTALPLPPAVSLTEHWWIWESGVLHVTPKTYPIASVKLTIRDPQDRWPTVRLEIDPRKESELVIWDRRFADGILAPSGEYLVQVRVCDDHNVCASAAGRISIPDGTWPTVTPTFRPATTTTALPSATSTRTRIPVSPTLILSVPSPTPSAPVSHPPPWPLWQMLGLAGLMIAIASASVMDPRPPALRRLGEVMEQISNRNQLDSSQDEK